MVTGTRRVDRVEEVMDNLTVGAWYVDRSLGHDGQPLNARFKLLSVASETVEVADEGGERRWVNRVMWEQDMEPLRKPLVRGTSDQ